MGETLQEHIIALAMQGRTIPVERLVAWGKELAAMLGHMHQKGLIYRDLKASNVIVAPDRRLRLIDFDVSMELPAERGLYSPGTIGYMSAQHSANEAPRVAHDVYSLGALLYFMATGADPSHFPHPYDLLKRPLEWLNPELPSSMADVIRRCLEPDPDARFQSMKEIIDAIDSVGHEARATEQVAANVASQSDYLEIARRLGDTLCNFAEYDPSGEGCYWRNPRYAEIPVIARNLAIGSVGTVLALAELVAELGEKSHRERLRDGAHWLAAQPYISDNPRLGLYNGEAGVAFALMRAGQVLKDDSLMAEALSRGKWLAGLPFSNPGIFDGAAGRVRFHLLLWDLTGDEEHLDAAIVAGEFLLGAAIKVGSQDEETGVLTGESEEKKAGPEMLCWVMPPGNGAHDGRIYTGYALGAAGVGDALLDLFDVTNDKRFYQAAEGAVCWLKSTVLPALNDGSGVDWPKVEGEPLQGAFWGHGASGVGIFLLNALQHGLISRSDSLLEGAAQTAARGTRWAGPTLAYGLGGPIEFLLDVYQQTSNRAYLDDAKQLAGILQTFASEQDGYLVWPSEDTTLFTPDLMVGYAGIATCMLRLGLSGYMPRVMSMAASRRNRLQAVHRKLATVDKA